MRHSFTALTLAFVLSLIWLPMPPISAAGSPPSPKDELIRNATLIFRRAVDTPSAAIPASVMQRARAVAVFPAAVGEAGCYSGLGIVSALGKTSRDWTMPAMIVFEGQIPVTLDVDSVDIIFVALTSRGVDYLERPESTLTGDSFIAPGALGQNTRVSMDADILAYMQFGDFFAGVTVEEFSIRHMTEVLPGGFRPPGVAQAWRDALASYFREMS